MKDYNLRSRDIYGDPKPKGPRVFGRLLFLVLLGGAGAAAYWYWHLAPLPDVETAAPASKTRGPDIIPLALPPRRDSLPNAAEDKHSPPTGR
jgi:hypothetical protein